MVMDVYKHSLVRNYANRPNCWTRSRIDVPQVDQGEICSMKDVALAVKIALFHIHLDPQFKPPQQLSGRSSEAGAIPGCGIIYPSQGILTG
jgi:hypothetical protein